MSFREKVLGAIFIMMGLSLGWAINARGDAQGPFFKKNLATCFYCDGDNSISPGLTINTPNMNNARAQLKRENKNVSNVALQAEPAKPLVGVTDNAPEAFKTLVRAYESGDMETAYREARRWVEYQDKILKRTSQLTTLVNKARAEISAQEAIENLAKGDDQMIVSALEQASHIESSPLRVYFFFDATSPTAIGTVSEIQSLYRSTLTDPAIEVIGIADGEVSIDDLVALKEATQITFPVRFDDDLVKDLNVETLPAVVALADNDPLPCRYNGEIERERLGEFIKYCLTKTGVARHER